MSYTAPDRSHCKWGASVFLFVHNISKMRLIIKIKKHLWRTHGETGANLHPPLSFRCFLYIVTSSRHVMLRHRLPLVWLTVRGVLFIYIPQCVVSFLFSIFAEAPWSESALVTLLEKRQTETSQQSTVTVSQRIEKSQKANFSRASPIAPKTNTCSSSSSAAPYMLLIFIQSPKLLSTLHSKKRFKPFLEVTHLNIVWYI